MRQVRLIRLETNPIYGTFGVLTIDSCFFCVTLEPYDRANQRSISNIPAQQYICRRRVSPKYGETFRVDDVPLRSQVLFHAGNVVKHTRGCIIVGQYVGKLRGNRAVHNSGNTFRKFMQEMDGYDQFQLTIVECY